ncbi:hypothetical protein Barb7_02545 [Bacteroidales bacterium Barb7]|nr:hypothetical protein Barb7_02545 [Bacteroidales bacterium Barb7]
MLLLLFPHLIYPANVERLFNALLLWQKNNQSSRIKLSVKSSLYLDPNHIAYLYCKKIVVVSLITVFSKCTTGKTK